MLPDRQEADLFALRVLYMPHQRIIIIIIIISAVIEKVVMYCRLKDSCCPRLKQQKTGDHSER
jgi:hypothetical protein